MGGVLILAEQQLRKSGLFLLGPICGGGVQILPLVYKICGVCTDPSTITTTSSSCSQPTDGNNSHCPTLSGKTAGCVTESLSLILTHTQQEAHRHTNPTDLINLLPHHHTHTKRTHTHTHMLFSLLLPHLTCFCSSKFRETLMIFNGFGAVCVCVVGVSCCESHIVSCLQEV